MFRKLDGLLLGAAQWFCDKIQMLFGITKFRLQKWACILFLVFLWGLLFVFAEFNAVPVVFCLLTTISSLFEIWMVEKEETEFLKERMLRHNPANSIYLRIGFLIAFVSFGISTFVFSEERAVPFAREFSWNAIISLVAWVYFSACIPRPPAKSKVREWCEKGLKFLKEVRGKIQPSPTPVPVPRQ